MSGALPHTELVRLHCGTPQAWFIADLGGRDMTWLAPHDGSPGRPAVFSDAAIQFCLTIKVLFKLPLRQATGMVSSLLEMANLDWAVPDYATLCRRQKTLAVQIPNRRADEPLNLLVDSTGIRFLDDGEWQARKHGVQGRRQGRKVHLAMATATSDIRAVEFTPSSDSRPGSGISAIGMAGETGPIRRIERRSFAFAAEISSCAMTVPIRRSGVSIRNP